ncbi:unnamed protein product [Gadus morhua 'NCC']
MNCGLDVFTRRSSEEQRTQRRYRALTAPPDAGGRLISVMDLFTVEIISNADPICGVPRPSASSDLQEPPQNRNEPETSRDILPGALRRLFKHILTSCSSKRRR